MQIHDIKPNHKNKEKKRVGRGGKKGTYSGRGMKGQKSRAGTGKREPLIRRVLKRYPKLRGYNNASRYNVHEVNIFALEKNFNDGDKVTPETLLEKKLIEKSKKLPIKILGEGETKKKLHIENCLISKTAKEAIEKAGGSVKTKE
ncbi:MAG: 50S ribosomal protein L15 [Candidatus Pacebacteria bacterium]|nr:50S ribosomal protein L15 [Candidatus Paceibacterota bacterium]